MKMTDESKTMTDLVERLRTVSPIFDHAVLCAEAAEALQAQAREIALLKDGHSLAWRALLERCESAESQLSTVRRDALEEAKREVWHIQKRNTSTTTDARLWNAVLNTLTNEIITGLSDLQSPVHAGGDVTTASGSPDRACATCGAILTDGPQPACTYEKSDPSPPSSVSGEGEGMCPVCPPGQCNSSGYPDDPCLAPQGETPSVLSYDERSLINRIKSKYKDAPTWADTDRLLAIIDRLSASPPPSKGVTEAQALNVFYDAANSYRVGGDLNLTTGIRAVLRLIQAGGV